MPIDANLVTKVMAQQPSSDPMSKISSLVKTAQSLKLLGAGQSYGKTPTMEEAGEPS